MKIAIEIPNEFINEYKKDKFDESLARILADIEDILRDKDNCSLAGRYEIETLEMLRKSLRDSMLLVDGDLKDYKLLADVGYFKSPIPIAIVSYEEEEE